MKSGGQPMTAGGVIHLNFTDFMARIQEQTDPALRGFPFVVGYPGKGRTTVLDVSGTAYGEGIRRGMEMAEARRLLRGIRIVEPDFPLYRRVESRIAEVAGAFTPLVESTGKGHFFLDISGTSRLHGIPADCAARIRRETAERVGILPTVGLSGNKLVSKIGTRVVRPEGFISVRPGDEEAFLKRQEIGLLPGIGPKLSERMRILRVREIGELASFSDDQVRILGTRGFPLRDRARGIDLSPVAAEPLRMRTLVRNMVLPADSNDPRTAELFLSVLIEELGLALRGEGLTAGGISVFLAYADGLFRRGAQRFPGPLHRDRQITAEGAALLRRISDRRVRIREIRVELFSLNPAFSQLDLFIPPEEDPGELLQSALDRIRARFGGDSVRPCALLGTLCTLPRPVERG